MPRMTSSEFHAFEARRMSRQQCHSEGDQELRRESILPERRLHDQIIDHCNQQWPRWKYIHARMDQKSTIAVGAHDFTLFLPGRVLCIECKRIGGKLSLEQQAWAMEMKQLGHVVHVIETFAEFLNLTSHENPTPNNNSHPPP